MFPALFCTFIVLVHAHYPNPSYGDEPSGAHSLQYCRRRSVIMASFHSSESGSPGRGGVREQPGAEPLSSIFQPSKWLTAHMRRSHPGPAHLKKRHPQPDLEHVEQVSIPEHAAHSSRLVLPESCGEEWDTKECWEGVECVGG